MDLLRIYLLAGLIIHKAVWELLKRRRGQPGAAGQGAARPLSAMLVKMIKVGILLGIIVQTMMPDVLPIESDSSSLRIAGVSIYTIGLVLAISSRIQLGRNWTDIESARVLNSHTVISNGIYGYIRHPIYVGDLLLLFGLELSLNSWLAAAVVVLAPVVLWKAIREEKMLVDKLPGYDAYCLRTKRFIPFLI
jgi:protein-S-isoprenylcysteine O-methyltransferase Ste14